jgi:hypothetical protein
MFEILDEINGYLWISDFVAMCVFGILALKLRNSSSFITMGVVVLISGVIIRYESLINSFVDPATSNTILVFWCAGFALFDCLMAYVLYKHYQTFKGRFPSKSPVMFAIPATVFVIANVYMQLGPLFFDVSGPSYKIWIIAAFYLGGALLDGGAIYTIYQLHNKNNKRPRLIARTYALAYFVAANLNVISFLELYLLETNRFANIYQWGFLSINTCTTLIVWCVACLAIFQYYNKQTRQGVLWKF